MLDYITRCNRELLQVMQGTFPQISGFWKIDYKKGMSKEQSREEALIKNGRILSESMRRYQLLFVLRDNN